MANPWMLVDRAALKDTVASIRTAAAKHGGSHVEVTLRENTECGVNYTIPVDTAANIMRDHVVGAT